MIRPSTLTILLIASLFAGCFGGDEVTDGRNDEPIFQIPGQSLMFYGCTGNWASMNFPGALSPIPHPGPASWDLPVYAPLTGVAYDMHECERIEWGPFVRGPIRLVLEVHDNADPPEPCLPGRFATVAILSFIAFDDPEIAAYAKEEYGMPSYHADIQLEESNFTGGIMREWSWEVDGHEKSALTVRKVHQQNQGDAVGDLRLFWPRGDAPVSVDLRWPGEVGFAFDITTEGSIASPTAFAAAGHEQYVGTNMDWLIQHDGEGSIIQYDDWDCTLPNGNTTA